VLVATGVVLLAVLGGIIAVVVAVVVAVIAGPTTLTTVIWSDPGTYDPVN
jgi:hypothetical protein